MIIPIKTIVIVFSIKLHQIFIGFIGRLPTVQGKRFQRDFSSLKQNERNKERNGEGEREKIIKKQKRSERKEDDREGKRERKREKVCV